MPDYSQIDFQCTKVKQELYRLKVFIEAIEHEENRRAALERFEVAYQKCDEVQGFLKSR